MTTKTKEKKVKAWAVMFSPRVLETLNASQNKKWFSPDAIFGSKEEAIKWRKCVHEGGLEARNQVAPIIKVEIFYSLPKKK